MRTISGVIITVLALAISARAQNLVPLEPKSQIVVLVDLSETWLNEKSRVTNKKVLEAIADGVGATAQRLKSPIQVDYLEIGDRSFSREPICSGRLSPSIFGSAAKQNDFSEMAQLIHYLRFNCTMLVLHRSPAPFTDISGALNTTSRLLSSKKLDYAAVIVVSDLKEEQRPGQVRQLLSLKGVHTLLVYRVLDADRDDPTQLDRRISIWHQALVRAGAHVAELDDIQVDAAQAKRLLGR